MLASVIVITAGLQAGKPVLLPIVLSGFLAIVSYPLTTFFKGRLRFPHWLAVTFTVIMDFGILGGPGLSGPVPGAGPGPDGHGQIPAPG